MVTEESVASQLKRIGFNQRAWGRGEVKELPHILLPDEHIYEVANGFYEGGFALLVATDVRVLLVDKKPLNYLNVEDLRFDMISEIDYNHRLFGANISISTGTKNLRFTSYNQPKLRKLIGHVQSCMAEQKRKQSEHAVEQKSHLEQINQQLQAYLLAQHRQQIDWQKQLTDNRSDKPLEPPEPIKPSPELSDYLFAQSLLEQYKQQRPEADVHPKPLPMIPEIAQAKTAEPQPQPSIEAVSNDKQLADLYAAGYNEVFGRHQPQSEAELPAVTQTQPSLDEQVSPKPLEVNALRIAYSKLPMALRNRKFGRPSFHAHSQQTTSATQPTPART